ncbi:hypothetical protein Dsin_023699 [Dipteronia sinensis]|uniref:Uncharacterized protein n=1 Tax=Dipteronia sinensis TaxID=43782 RepID=A0AAE0A425_9ROSI|nr:hypothetical protein Dsin_023699 [Dipteronia sinensis]
MTSVEEASRINTSTDSGNNEKKMLDMGTSSRLGSSAGLGPQIATLSVTTSTTVSSATTTATVSTTTTTTNTTAVNTATTTTTAICSENKVLQQTFTLIHFPHHQKKSEITVLQSEVAVGGGGDGGRCGGGLTKVSEKNNGDAEKDDWFSKIPSLKKLLFWLKIPICAFGAVF